MNTNALNLSVWLAIMSVKKDSRLVLIAFVFSLSSVIIIGRLFTVQVIKGEVWADKADRQYLKENTATYNRGTIFFKTKDGVDITAAGLNHGYTLAMIPNQIESAEQAYLKLSSVIEINKDDFLAKAAKKEDPYEEVAVRLDEQTAEKIKALGISGLNLYKQKWRSYPNGPLASHLIGFVGYNAKNEEKLEGIYGLEKQYEKVLSRNDYSHNINSFAEIFTELGRALSSNADKEGDIYLTVDPVVQNFIENEIKTVKEIYKAEEIGAIIMDPKTGALKVMAALPNYDPSGEKDNISALNNPNIESVYEMGSIMKPLTLASALDAGAITPDTQYADNGFVVLNNARIENYDGKGRGTVSMQEVLNQSLNTGAVFAMQKLGREKFRNYMLNFGLSDKSGIDLPNEISGLTDNLESKRDIEYATASFGQGIAVTPMAMTRALATLGNGGVLVTPYVVNEIKYKTKLSKKTISADAPRVLKEETSEEITRMLVKVFDEALIGGKYRIDRYSVAAKTGTAQMMKEGGGYDEEKYLHSFFGYFPAYNPRFIVFLYLREPVGARYASETLSEPFANIAKFLINYYNVPPDR